MLLLLTTHTVLFLHISNSFFVFLTTYFDYEQKKKKICIENHYLITCIIYNFHFCNRKCGTPLKPKVIVMIASDAGQNRTKVSPIPIVAAQLNTKKKVKIVYGSIPFLAFETIVSIDCYIYIII